jgi:hypothetical protein
VNKLTKIKYFIDKHVLLMFTNYDKYYFGVKMVQNSSNYIVEESDDELESGYMGSGEDDFEIDDFEIDDIKGFEILEDVVEDVNQNLNQNQNYTVINGDNDLETVNSEQEDWLGWECMSADSIVEDSEDELECVNSNHIEEESEYSDCLIEDSEEEVEFMWSREIGARAWTMMYR